MYPFQSFGIGMFCFFEMMMICMAMFVELSLYTYLSRIKSWQLISVTKTSTIFWSTKSSHLENTALVCMAKSSSHVPTVNVFLFVCLFLVTEWEMTTNSTILYPQSTFVLSQKTNVSWNWTWEKHNSLA